MKIDNDSFVTTVTFDFGSVEKTLDAADVATAFVRLLNEDKTVIYVGGCAFNHMGHNLLVAGGGNEVVRVEFEDAREIINNHSYHAT